MRHEATQGLDALLLVLWGTAGVGAGAGRPARLRQRRCAGFRDRAGSRSPRKTPRGGIRRTVRNHEGAARPPRNAARPHQLGRRRSQSSHGRRPRCLPFHSGVLSPPCRSLCVATWQGWMKPEPGPVLSRSPPPRLPREVKAALPCWAPGDRLPQLGASHAPRDSICQTAQSPLSGTTDVGPSTWRRSLCTYRPAAGREGGGTPISKAGSPTWFPAEEAAVGLGRFAGALSCLHGSLWA